VLSQGKGKAVRNSQRIKTDTVWRKTTLLLTLTLLLLLIAACGESAGDLVREGAEESDAVAAVEPTPEEAEATPTPSPTVPDPTATPAATSTPEPTPTTEPAEVQAITIVDYGFGQLTDRREVGYAIIIENPNAGVAFESSQYQVAILDDEGTVLSTNSGYLQLILPEERAAVAGSTFLPEGETAASLEVSFKEGRAEPLDVTTGFTASQETFLPDEYYPKVTGIISNPYSIDLDDVLVSAVTFDEAGEISGSGYTYMHFIPAHGETGVDMSVSVTGEPAHVELYASMSGLTLLHDRSDDLQSAELLELHSQGFGQQLDRREVGWGFLVENTNVEAGIERAKYTVTLFDDQGYVIGTDYGYITLLLPGETLGIAGGIYPPEGYFPEKIVVQVLSGSAVELDAREFFAADDATFVDDEYYPKVTGRITNLTDETLDDVIVSAIAYNDGGDIIGGGYTYVDFVPANGNAAAEVSIQLSETPARVELHPTLSSLTLLTSDG
jgi:hypothetical protein